MNAIHKDEVTAEKQDLHFEIESTLIEVCLFLSFLLIFQLYSTDFMDLLIKQADSS